MVKKIVLILFLNLLLIPLRIAYAPNVPDLDKLYLSQITAIRHEKEMDRFVSDMRVSESPDWTTINRIGCMGWFQFAYPTLKYLGYGQITPNRFKKDPGIFPQELQISLFKTLLKFNEAQLSDCIDQYRDLVIGGILITKSGILAGAHLGGASGVRAYLISGGKVNYRDIYGTKISDYIKKFQGYSI